MPIRVRVCVVVRDILRWRWRYGEKGKTRNEHFQVLICICNGKIENFHVLSSAILQRVNSLPSTIGGGVVVVVFLSSSADDLTNYQQNRRQQQRLTTM